MADKRATLTLKLGGNEIRYEAERQAVEAKLDHVLDRLLREPAGGVQVGLVSAPSGPGDRPPAAPTAAPEVVEARQLEQLFRIAKGGRLRLRKLPTRTADTAAFSPLKR